MSDSDDPRERLALLVVRLRAATDAERPGVVELLLPLLSENRIPIAVRVAAAARAMESLPDTEVAINSVVRAITARVSPSAALRRLRHIQNQAEKTDALDAIIADREQKLQVSCPRCGVRLSHVGMVKHLWYVHQLTLVGDKTRTRGGEVAALRREYATSGDPALLDHAALIGGEAALSVWAAETATGEESLPFCRAARTHGAGLCPSCFGEVPSRVPELPPLAFAHGRVAGDGHSASAASFFSHRMSATLAAAFVLIVVGGLIHFLLGVVFAAAAYCLLFFLLAPRDSLEDRAIDTAWHKLAHRLADQRNATRFLTRLCLTSVGLGDPLERANTLIRMISRARDNGEVQLYAVALTLQMDDAGRFGRDRAAGVADLVAPAFRGELPTYFAEFVLTAYFHIPREAAELTRLRILLHAAAFAAGLAPQDVLDVCNAAPHIAEAMRLPPYHLAMLYGVWMQRISRSWGSVGGAETVFELTANARTTAGKLLIHEPGLLLVCETDEDVEAEFGPLLIAAGGVSIGGMVVSDASATVRLENNGRELIFGKHTLKLRRTIPESFAEELRAWLRFRTEVLELYPAAYLRNEVRPVSRWLVPFAVRCASCGTESLPTVGAIGRAL